VTRSTAQLEHFRPAQLRADRDRGIALQVTPKSAGTGVVVIRLYDVIDSWGGFWGISAKEVAAALDDLGEDVVEVRVHINSPGGMAHEGIAILNLLRQHPAKVVTVVDGLAASAASLIAMGGDEVVVMPNAEMMIHDASGGCWGNAADMHAYADTLEHLSANVASAYATRAGGTVEQWRAAMLAETWYSAQEAVDAGLADRVGTASADDDGDAPTAAFDTSFFLHARRADAPAPTTPTATSAAGKPSPKEKKMQLTDEQAKRLCAAAGVADDTDDPEVLGAAVEEATDEAAPDSTPVATAPPGTRLIDDSTYEQLRADAAAGRRRRRHRRAAHAGRPAAARGPDGRVTPAQRGTAPSNGQPGTGWLGKLHAEGEIGEQVLAGLSPGLVPTAEIGHAGDGTDPQTLQAVTESAAYKSWSSQ
jgi:ATP-dependent Clp endopeptidase proteolytic subunit ClpP